MVWGVLLLRPNLDRARFKIGSDHDALHWGLNLGNVSAKLARWLLRLSKFEFDVVPRSGIKHQAADALWRLSSDRRDKTELNDALPSLKIVRANRAKEEEEYDKNTTLREEFNVITPVLPAVYKFATIPFIEPTIAKFPPQQSKHPPGRQPAPAVGKPGSDYS